MTPAERILGKALAASPMKSADWSSIQAGLRDRAFFSATVDDARRLAVMRAAVSKVAAGELDESQARLAIREALERTGYQRPDDVKEGSIRDLYSQRRLDLVIQTNVAEARGYVRYLEGTSEGALAAFPCQELVRTQNRKAPRNWPEIWKGHGGSLYGSGRMIALKTDPIWTAISRFGHPWPPFDFGSGMGLRDVGRREAIRYGVISADDPPPKIDREKRPGFNDNLSEHVPFKGKEDPGWIDLQSKLGDQIAYRAGEVIFRSELLRSLVRGNGPEKIRLGKATPAMLAKLPTDRMRASLSGTSFSVRQDWIRDHVSKHIGAADTDPRNIPLQEGDAELLPSIWRNPDRILAGQWPGSAVFELDTFDGGTLALTVKAQDGATPLTLFKRRNP